MNRYLIVVDEMLPKGALDAYGQVEQIDEHRYVVDLCEHRIRDIVHQFGVVSVEKF